MMKSFLRKGLWCCFFAFLANVTFAQSSDNNDFVQVGEILFSSDFENEELIATDFVMYDVDKFTPTKTMQTIGFAVDKPWILLKDSESSSNHYFGSTSAYTPAGQANDWLVTKAIKIPTTGYILTWKSQAYDPKKRDGIKVFISSTGQKVENFTDAPIFSVDEEEAGATDNADGEWTEHSVKLDTYAGKTIYVAFVNQSNDKSLLFLDDIAVELGGIYSLENTTGVSVETQTEVTIKGNLHAIEDTPITAYSVFYKGKDEEIHTRSFEGLNIKKGESHSFEFPKKMAVEIGKINNYKLWVHVENELNQGFNDSIYAFAFKPLRRIVIEEGTGAWCGACPQGILALEHIEKIYNDTTVIPIAVHQGNDPYAYKEYADGFLNFPSYPAGLINRKYNGFPVSNDFEFSGPVSSSYDGTFFDLVEKAKKEMTFTKMKVTGSYTDDAKTKIQIDTEVQFAIDVQNGQDYRLFYVIREDDLLGKQANYLATNTNPNAGEWGNGGIYGQSVATVFYKDVARTVQGSFTGIAKVFPASINHSEPLTYSFSKSIGTKISKPEDVSVVAMLLNGKTGEIENSAVVYLGTPGAGIKDQLQDSDILVTVSGDNVYANINNASGKAYVSLVSVDGKVINASSQSDGEFVLSSNGYRGVALLKVSMEGKVVVKKIIL